MLELFRQKVVDENKFMHLLGGLVRRHSVLIMWWFYYGKILPSNIFQ